MLEIQVRLLMTLLDLTTMTRSRLRDAHDDWERGEVTSTTAIIVILVVAALAAGAIIAQKITANANKVPVPN